MSGHSKWSTIKHQKEAKDQKRGTVFTKMARAITVAVRKGGSPDPETNFALRLVIERARAANMPKDNIQKAIARGAGKGEGEGATSLKEAVYEGFGPGRVAIVVETLTDNTNRTVSELKKIFERGGGSLASPGAAAYLFEKKGLILLAKEGDLEEVMLELIDLGVEDVNEVSEGVEVHISTDRLAHFGDLLTKGGFKVQKMEIVMRPKTKMVVADQKEAEKVGSLLKAISDHNDVQKVWANFEIRTETS
jgi:YebC/PmpR family DNA-binding regulatory protein